MAYITYEYLGSELVEGTNDWQTHVFDDGHIGFGSFTARWFQGGESCPDNEVKKRIKVLNKITDSYGNKKYRNITYKLD